MSTLRPASCICVLRLQCPASAPRLVPCQQTTSLLLEMRLLRQAALSGLAGWVPHLQIRIARVLLLTHFSPLQFKSDGSRHRAGLQSRDGLPANGHGWLERHNVRFVG